MSVLNKIMDWMGNNPRPCDRIIYHEVVMDQCYTRYYNIRPGDHILDAGSHLGVFTIYAAERAGKDGLVISYEPDKQNFKLLQNFVSMLNPDRDAKVLCINSALWSHSGIGILERTVSNSGGHQIHEIQGMTSKLDRSNIISLVQVTDLWNKLDFIKLDVEGSEVRVLNGMIDLLKKFKPFIAMEVHSDTLFREIKNILEPLKYEVFPEGEGRRNCYARIK